MYLIVLFLVPIICYVAMYLIVLFTVLWVSGLSNPYGTLAQSLA